MKGFKPSDIRENGKQSTSHTSKLLGYMNISVVKGIPNGMQQKVLNLIHKLKQIGEGRLLKGELKVAFHHLRLSLKGLVMLLMTS
jgi:hypothetical protein